MENENFSDESPKTVQLKKWVYHEVSKNEPGKIKSGIWNQKL
jgi:hypothetical protein